MWLANSIAMYLLSALGFARAVVARVGILSSSSKVAADYRNSRFGQYHVRFSCMHSAHETKASASKATWIVISLSTYYHTRRSLGARRAHGRLSGAPGTQLLPACVRRPRTPNRYVLVALFCKHPAAAPSKSSASAESAGWAGPTRSEGSGLLPPSSAGSSQTLMT